MKSFTAMRSVPSPLRTLCAAPRAHLFTLQRSLVQSTLHSRNLSTSPRPRKDNKESSSSIGLRSGPSPPRLPKEEQEIFESLQRQSTGAFSTPRSEQRPPPPQINQSPNSSPAEVSDAQNVISQRVEKVANASTATIPPTSPPSTTPAAGDQPPSKFKDMYDKVIQAKGKGEELHPDMVRRAQPEFEGDVNPKTGEVGGPKNDPLRWGGGGEWTYNGRATDF